MDPKTTLPHAATVYLTNAEGKILGVSRKHNKNDFGLPGGKVDRGETDEEAAIREVKEETGLIVSNLRVIFEDTDDHEYWTVCFLADYSGDISSKEEGSVKWIDRDTLLSGCFGGYNKKLLNAIDSREK